MSQADICRELDVDKSTVSRWFSGFLPSENKLPALAAALSIEPNMMFRHPDDDWISRFFDGRSQEERARIIATIETAFPRKSSN